ncbi:cation:proton antiporter regulatory subunit [Pelotomaculum terephthalicicum JT]|uniref:cation:proton antiporter regulatory subunit n=1 Tax=Pelotomaculum TaxID=191373 RepID=UPI0009C81022|nr:MULTISPECIES: cation:proton antiporter regulatory subunit [Pelotomaculum]MCG9968234.1 cation:proton antiporter regulatory subunit [Pelotomaculum terephthalicicum JT]OPX91185.1 MAG: K(+)/H(+) antiporter subunit KhtT [Pelotomaculum sp. PtaB.Bin117]OPY60422.1 MAG: K(+)/H(+) antiporter subunit KhtT [Pelotomaculum sp. PtaU1.Bin065]
MNLIRESDLPGIGRKFQINTISGDKLVIVVHDDGRREMHHFDDDDPDDSISMVMLNDAEARCVGGILGGMSYMPKALESVDMAFDEMVIEWYKLEPGIKSIGLTIGDLGIRKRTGASIIAIVNRDHSKIINPGPEQTIKEGATIVILGEREKVKACKRLLQLGSI